jgi:hypothetical protein
VPGATAGAEGAGVVVLAGGGVKGAVAAVLSPVGTTSGATGGGTGCCTEESPAPVVVALIVASVELGFTGCSEAGRVVVSCGAEAATGEVEVVVLLATVSVVEDLSS